MAQLNYYLGVKRGDLPQTVKIVTAGTTTAGTAVDVEVNIQINNGSSATGITRKDVNLALDIIKRFINSGGLNHAGADLPAL